MKQKHHMHGIAEYCNLNMGNVIQYFHCAHVNNVFVLESGNGMVVQRLYMYIELKYLKMREYSLVIYLLTTYMIYMLVYNYIFGVTYRIT